MKHKIFLQSSSRLTSSFHVINNRFIQLNQSNKIPFPDLGSLKKTKFSTLNYYGYYHYYQRYCLSAIVNPGSSNAIFNMATPSFYSDSKRNKNEISKMSNKGRYQQSRLYTSSSYTLTLDDIEESISIESDPQTSKKKLQQQQDDPIENLVSSSILPDNVKNRLQDGLKYGYFGDNLYLCHSFVLSQTLILFLWFF